MKLVVLIINVNHTYILINFVVTHIPHFTKSTFQNIHKVEAPSINISSQFRLDIWMQTARISWVIFKALALIIFRKLKYNLEYLSMQRKEEACILKSQSRSDQISILLNLITDALNAQIQPLFLASHMMSHMVSHSVISIPSSLNSW